jgi:subtilisin family serine protease
VRRRLAAWLLALLILGPAPASQADVSQRQVFIVYFEEAPLVRDPDAERHRGGRVDVRSHRARQRLRELDGRQIVHLRTLSDALGRTVRPIFRYRVVTNGVAVRLTPDEAGITADLPGVLGVAPEGIERLQTDRTPSFIGAKRVWKGFESGEPGTLGEGVVVGVIDSGVNMDHPSFADDPEDGHVFQNPRGSGSFLGWCDPANPDFDPAHSCNDKLIGAWDFVDALGFEADGPDDSDDHGSHVAATAVGNRIDLDGDGRLDLAGIAPHAQLIVYDACYQDAISTESLCPQGALMAALDQAVLDGVDVINFSITGGRDPWAPGDVGPLFLNALEAGIVPVSAAGNDRLGAGRTEHRGPWMLSVAASTHDRTTVETRLVELSGGDATPAELVGSSRSGSYGPAPVALAAAAVNGDSEPEQCLNAFPPGTWVAGEIVLCDRGVIARVQKCEHVALGGAGGCILADVPDGEQVGEEADAHIIPAIHVDAEEGETLRQWLSAGTGHTARITAPAQSLDPGTGDVLASFSSRGPAPGLDVLKPNLTAPGVSVFAAGTDSTFDVPGLLYRLQSGTSMASPHVAGVAALLRSLFPDWSPSELASALESTALTDVVLGDGSPSDAFDRGSGRLDAAAAARAGLVLHEDAQSFREADPARGGEPRTLNVPSLLDGACPGTCSWSRELGSVAAYDVSWRASMASAAGVVFGVKPSSFRLAPGASVSLSVEAEVTDPRLLASWVFSELLLEPDVGELATARLPVAVRPTDWVPDAPEPLEGAVTATVKLRFDRAERDSLRLRIKQWQPRVDLDPARLELRVDFGGVVVPLVLDDRGRQRDRDLRARLKRKKDGSYQLKLHQKRSDIAQLLADDGLVDELNRRPGKPVTLSLALRTDETAWLRTVDLVYRSKAGRWGKAKP